jgi:putative SOS response-associated peptidase YedK
MASYNVAPLHIVPVIRNSGSGLQVTGMRWGQITRQTGSDARAHVEISARAETLRPSPAAGEGWYQGQRCLIPATGYYVWRAEPGGKQPWLVRCADQEVFAFAGLWSAGGLESGDADSSCSIVSLPASAGMRDLDNTRFREPAILHKEDWQSWLGADAAAALARLRPYPDAQRVAWQVSRRVNSCMQNDVSLLERVASRPARGAPEPVRTLERPRALSRAGT